MLTFPSLRCALPALVIALTACSGGADPEPEENGAIQENGAPRQSANGAPGAAPSARSTEVDAIPAQFLGVWDQVDGDCLPSSDLRMDVRPREIEFYESLGKVANVEVEDARTALVTLDMTGEGETWQVTNRFNLNDDGTRLTPEHVGEDDGFTPIPLKKCSGASTDA